MPELADVWAVLRTSPVTGEEEVFKAYTYRRNAEKCVKRANKIAEGSPRMPHTYRLARYAFAQADYDGPGEEGKDHDDSCTAPLGEWCACE